MSVIDRAVNKIRASRLAELRRQEGAQQLQPGEPAPDAVLLVEQSFSLPQSALVQRGLMPSAEHRRRNANEYRHVKRPVLANAFGRGAPAIPRGRLVVVTSAVPGEGKTFTSLNLAANIALEREVSVLLVDGDVAKGGLTHALGFSASTPGLLDALSAAEGTLEPFIMATDQPSLYFLARGSRSPTAAELLASSRMQQLFDDLLARNPALLVLFDSPPLLVGSEASTIAAVCGQVLVVVRAEVTQRHVLTDALANVDEGRYTALLLNQCPPTIGSSYGYEYGDDDDVATSQPDEAAGDRQTEQG